MKEELIIKIRKNILEEILERLTERDKKEFNDIVEDALMSYFGIKLTDLESPIKQDDGFIVLDDPNYGYYVYVFMDPSIKCKIKTGIENISFNYEPFYIGKGIGNRMEKPERNESVNARIEHLRSRGIDPVILKIKEGLVNIEACKLENYLIEKIGRSDLGKGTLLNMAGGITFNNIEDVPFHFTELNIEKNLNSMILDGLNKTKRLKDAAKKLGISERSLYRKIKSLDIIRNNGKYEFNKKAD